MPLFDAHCHLQDPRLIESADLLLTACEALGVEKTAVNGTSEKDWSAVSGLASRSRCVLPSYGLHPWFVKERGEDWKEVLLDYWESDDAHVGEIGLDRWIRDFDIEDQIEVFRWQLRQAERLDKACTIHCLKAFGILETVLREECCLPQKGFLLHSYGGSAEMIPGFASMGAYFSFSAYFSLERKEKQREVFRSVPLDRLLIETDSPDMLGDSGLISYPRFDERGESINDPRNIVGIYDYVAEMLNVDRSELEEQVADNFRRLFC
tara:strand:+ start:999 stop:1793 length:795 start_codon:yes stop_codon:yes gene_type:complete